MIHPRLECFTGSLAWLIRQWVMGEGAYEADSASKMYPKSDHFSLLPPPTSHLRGFMSLLIGPPASILASHGFPHPLNWIPNHFPWSVTLNISWLLLSSVTSPPVASPCLSSSHTALVYNSWNLQVSLCPESSSSGSPLGCLLRVIQVSAQTLPPTTHPTTGPHCQDRMFSAISWFSIWLHRFCTLTSMGRGSLSGQVYPTPKTVSPHHRYSMNSCWMVEFSRDSAISQIKMCSSNFIR